MAAGFERYIHSGAPGFIASLTKCHYLCVCLPWWLSTAFAYDHTIFYYNRAYRRIWASQPPCLLSETERAFHVIHELSTGRIFRREQIDLPFAICKVFFNLNPDFALVRSLLPRVLVAFFLVVRQ